MSCKKKTARHTAILRSDFDLHSDLGEFKNKMTDVDTIKLFFDHSVCTYEGLERIEITKKSDSLKVRSLFKELTFKDHNDPEWQIMYEKSISENDTVWPLHMFIARNNHRQNSTSQHRRILSITHHSDTLNFYTDGLADLNRFLQDYYLTMKRLHPENKNGIYGYDILEE